MFPREMQEFFCYCDNSSSGMLISLECESSRCCHNIVTSYNHHLTSGLCACMHACADISVIFPRLLLNGLSSGAFLEVYHCLTCFNQSEIMYFLKKDLLVP